MAFDGVLQLSRSGLENKALSACAGACSLSWSSEFPVSFYIKSWPRILNGDLSLAQRERAGFTALKQMA